MLSNEKPTYGYNIGINKTKKTYQLRIDSILTISIILCLILIFYKMYDQSKLIQILKTPENI